MKKIKNETDAALPDVYEIFASKFCHFSHLSSKMKVDHAFKAKKEAFCDRNPQRTGGGEDGGLRTGLSPELD